jgi:ABC-type uncharacterized transport system fused permease/ATPase subunit
VVLWSKKYPADPQSEWPLMPHELDDRFRHKLGRQILFKELSENVHAFRSKLFEVGLFKRIDRGVIGILLWNYEDRNVEVKIYLDWISMALRAVLFVALLIEIQRHFVESLFNITFMILVFALVYVFVELISRILIGRWFHKVPTIYDEIGIYAARRWSHLEAAYGVNA